LDITDRKLAEEALHEAFEDSKLFMAERQTLESQLRQAQKLEAIGQLAAGIAHEINTPTQYVGDNTKFLKESWKSIAPLLAEAQKMFDDAQASAESPQLPSHFADCIETADLAYVLEEIPLALDQSLDGLQRIAGIVRAMKEFSHPGSQETQSLDINHAIENTIIVARNEWKYVAEVRTCFDPNLPLVPCFVAEFNQVILNLLVNAAQAIAGGKGENSPGKGDILITTKLDGNWVEIQIQDSGPGIPEAIRNRIFEPFFTTKPVGGGTGQGLALVHSVIVKKHGGKTWFESEVGKGTTFFVRLPVIPAG
jgi:signal transduction histidine kinase